MDDHRQHLDQDSYIRRVVPNRITSPEESQRALYSDLHDFTQQNQHQSAVNAHQQFNNRLGSSSAFQSFHSSNPSNNAGMNGNDNTPMRSQQLHNVESQPSRPTFSPGPMLPIESMQRNNNSGQYNIDSNLNRQGSGSSSVASNKDRESVGGYTPGPRRSAGLTSESPQYGAFTFASPLAEASEQFVHSVVSGQSRAFGNEVGEGNVGDRTQESSPDNLLRYVDFIRVGMGDGDSWGQMGNTYPAPPSYSVEPEPSHGSIFGGSRSTNGDYPNSATGQTDLARSTTNSQCEQNFLGSFDPQNSVDGMDYGFAGSIFGSSSRGPSSDVRFPSADYTPAGQATSNYFGNNLLESLGGSSPRQSVIDYRNDGSESMRSQGINQFGGLLVNRESWDMHHHQQQQQRGQQQHQEISSPTSSSLNAAQTDVSLSWASWASDGSVASSFGAPPRSLSPTSYQQGRSDTKYGEKGGRNAFQTSQSSYNYSHGGSSQPLSHNSTDMRNFRQQDTNTNHLNSNRESGYVNPNHNPSNAPDLRKSFPEGNNDGRDPQRRNSRHVGGERSSRDGPGLNSSGRDGSGHNPNRNSVNRSQENENAKSAYKDFQKNLRLKEKESLEAAIEYAEAALTNIPEVSKWKVYAELADLVKKSDQIERARSLYSTVCELNPTYCQGWLEWSKLEEDCGDIKRSLKVLKKGLEHFNHFNDQLLTRAIKQQERLNNVEDARKMLSVLKHESIDKGWKPMLEGALMEGRDGKIQAAREFLKYLISHVPWYGPIYGEAFRLEEKCQNYESAYLIVRQGLKELPRYGPLWFGLMRLSEKDDMTEESSNWACGVRPELKRTRAEKLKGVRSISRELVWKLHLEAGQAEERAADLTAEGRNRRKNISLQDARNRLYGTVRYNYAQSLISCPSNLRWKVWLAGARLELAAGQLAVTRKLLRKAYEDTPEKSRAYVYLECSRVEEYIGNISGARRILETARKDVKQEWKVFLESVLLEARDGNMLLAIEVAKRSLTLHTGTGRLWALLIQLCHRQECLPSSQFYMGVDMDVVLSGYDLDGGIESTDVFENLQGVVPLKTDVLRKALDEVPKSGEVWCEGARVYMNPLLLGSFDLIEAQRELNFAIQFTPQYGDTFIEYLRLEIMMQVLLSNIMDKLGLSLRKFVNTFLSEEPASDILSVVNENEGGSEDEVAKEISREQRVKDIIAMEKMEPLTTLDKNDFKNIVVEKLCRRCLNADPNYGTLWFACRLKPYDTPRSILKEAIQMLVHEILTVHDIYIRAISRYVRRCMQYVIRHYKQNEVKESAQTPQRLWIDSWEAGELEEDFQQAEKHFGSYYRSETALKIPMVHISTGTFTSCDFVSGLIDLNRTLFKKGLEGEERRKVLFGSDHYSIA